FNGGIGLGVANPKNMDSPLTIRLYSTNTIFDYNSTIPHPPYFTYDKGEGIDYLGYYSFRVLPQDPVLNFSEMNIFDRSLQLSQNNYTAGNSATSKLQPPTPQIKADYDPILRDWSELRCYPGGQTHTGRAVSADPSILTKGSGRNAYPAIYDMYKKLGTEFFPLTDYCIAFNLRDAEKNHYSFDPRLEQRSQLAKVIVKGPFMFPKLYDEPSGKIDTSYRYKNVDNVPIQYDTSGYLEITANNQALWEVNGIGLNRIINPYRATPAVISYANKNKYARYSHSMYYGGNDYTRGGFFEGDWPKDDTTPSGQYQYWFQYYCDLYFYSPSVGYIPSTYPYVPNSYMNYDCKTFILDELIPTGPGKIEITVETANGATKTYQDCCQDNITDGISVEGLGIKIEGSQQMMVDADNTLDLLVTENFPSQYDPGKPSEERACNDAVVVAWQDRGALDGNTGAIKGAGDGWMTNPPRSSDYTVLGTAFLPSDDLNSNGKVSFNDWETEIIGTYDMATNTWSSGIIDGRTFMRGSGKYTMAFTQNNGSRLDTIGVDFGGLNVRQTNAITNPDGVIGDDEVLPIIINAYKYGDDNNDRAFTPFFNVSGEYPQYSHEVYLAGRIEIPIESQQEYSVSLIPGTLTAGVQPELQDPTEPLTFLVSDDAGIPVDILKEAHKMIQGVKEEDIDPISMHKAIWNNLFKDPHPDPLPQYYWTRIDLHNDDGTQIGNVPLYSGSTGRFEAISFDMTQSPQGKYAFKGFVANDAGDFTVSVYSVDRRKVGRVKVEVVLPTVSYFVSNYDDKKKTEYEVPGEPDFVMTAGDNDIYRIRVNVKDAQGRPVKGLGRSVSICGGSDLELARFTPFATPLKNYYRAIEPWFTSFYGDGAGYYRKMNMTTGNGAYSKYFWIALMFTNRWDIHFGVDTNLNGRIDAENNETERTRPFAHNYSYTTDYGYFYAYRSQGYAYYNTENYKYDDGLNDITPVFDANLKLSPFKGWGLGAIYNRPYYSPENYGLMFANFDKRGNDVSGEPLSLSNTDSLNLDINGETEFYVFGEDVCEVGGLVGKNTWSISTHSDVAGSSWNYTISSPDSMMTRFGRQLVLASYYRGRQAFVNSRDITYRIDWDAMPSKVVKLRPPTVEPRYADTLQPLGKSFFNENYYDLIYGQENHVQFIFLPADKRDLPLEENMKMVLAGNQVEYRVSGRVARDPQQQEEHPSTTMFVTPTGTGGDAISLDIVSDNTRKDLMRYDVEYGSNNISQKPPPDTYYITNIARFDIMKGLQIIATSLSGPLSVNGKAQLKIIVQELGTKMPVENASVTLNGAGVKASKTTDKSGVCYFDITPTSKEVILIEAKKENYASGKNMIDIGAVSGKNDLIQLDQIPTRTNQTQYVLKGKVSADVAGLTINKTNVSIQKDGFFQYTVTLKEGMNTVVIELEDRDHRTTRKMISIELKTTGPTLILDKSILDQQWVEVQTVAVSGKTEANATVLVNQLPVKQVGMDWSVDVPVLFGKNIITIMATDELGNTTKESISVYVYKKQRVEFFIGSKQARVNDNEITIDEAPFISQNRTYVPIRVVSEVLGAELTWNPDTRGITIRKGNQTIDMVVGSVKAVVNNQIVELDAPPLLRNGRTSVPVRFISEYLQGSVQWNERIKMILIEFLI
ncbi:copper amine oxidase N-terminal domain-containing protein, partial [bacterium]|nr:copper amine oxidase N-terminal domain-containing protein [bacterium]